MGNSRVGMLIRLFLTVLYKTHEEKTNVFDNNLNSVSFLASCPFYKQNINTD